MAGIDDIKELRSDTSMSVTDVKNALEQADGDMQKAREFLRSRGAEIAKKKQEREAGDGIIETYLHVTKKTGVIL